MIGPLKRCASASLINLAGTVAAAVMTLLVLLLVVQPIAGRRADALARSHDRVRQMQLANAATAEMQSLRLDIAAVHREIDASRLQLRPAAAVNERLAALVELSNQHRLLVQNLQPAAAKVQHMLNVIPLRMTGRGGYLACAEFIHELGTTFADTGLRAFTLRSAADGQPGCEFDFELNWLTTAERSGPAETVASVPVQ